MCSADSVRAERDKGLEIGVAVISAIFLAENAIVFYPPTQLIVSITGMKGGEARLKRRINPG